MFQSLALALALTTSGLWYSPDHDGVGLLITKDSGYGSAVIWFGYTREHQPAWLISTDTCSEFPCRVGIAEPVGSWMGSTPVELVEVGEVRITPLGDGRLEFYYVFHAWPSAGECGRMLGKMLTGCMDTWIMERLTE